MAPEHPRILLVRHGELALKSPRVRARLMRTLTRRIEEALERAGLEGLVRQLHSRHIVEANDLPAAKHAVSRVFGITSLSEATAAPVESEALQDAAADYTRTHWPEGAESFAIRGRRTGNHPYTSQEMARATGSAVWKAMEQTGVPVRVDLDEPDWALNIEVREKEAYLFHDRLRGPGGLPLGSQGRVVVWLTDADSAVAAYQMMRRGAQIVPYYFPQILGTRAATTPVQQEDAHVVHRIHKALRAWGASKQLHPIRLDPQTVTQITGDPPPDDGVPLARLALEQGGALGRRLKAHALVTGETRHVPWADRLPDAHRAVELPVLRPLMGLDRQTIDEYRASLELPPRGRSPQGKVVVTNPGGSEEAVCWDPW